MCKDTSTYKCQCDKEKPPVIHRPVMRLISDMKLLEIDHSPDGYPAVTMSDISSLVAEIERCHMKLSAVADYARHRGMKTLERMVVDA